MKAPAYRVLPSHGRFSYSPIAARHAFRWPDGSRLAVYLGFNIEHFSFGEGLGPAIGPVMPEPEVLNYAWREYALRVGYIAVLPEPCRSRYIFESGAEALACTDGEATLPSAHPAQL